jgi:methionine synthase II (cobalamin-independent)
MPASRFRADRSRARSCAASRTGRFARSCASRRTSVGRGITEGEFRWTHFHSDFLAPLDGVQAQGGIALRFQRADGEVDFAPPVLRVPGKVRHLRPIQVADFEFLRSATRGVPKVTLPSPTRLRLRRSSGDLGAGLSGP